MRESSKIKNTREALQIIDSLTSRPFQKCGVRQSEEFSTEGEEIEDQNKKLRISDKSMSDEFKEECWASRTWKAWKA